MWDADHLEGDEERDEVVGPGDERTAGEGDEQAAVVFAGDAVAGFLGAEEEKDESAPEGQPADDAGEAVGEDRRDGFEIVVEVFGAVPGDGEAALGAVEAVEGNVDGEGEPSRGEESEVSERPVQAADFEQHAVTEE